MGFFCASESLRESNFRDNTLVKESLIVFSTMGSPETTGFCITSINTCGAISSRFALSRNNFRKGFLLCLSKLVHSNRPCNSHNKHVMMSVYVHCFSLRQRNSEFLYLEKLTTIITAKVRRLHERIEIFW
jgi:hypothetical protein